jgi:putative hydroxymethylpyrimidine transport system substrate-binding protein
MTEISRGSSMAHPRGAILARFAILFVLSLAALGGMASPAAATTKAAAPVRTVTVWLDWYPNTDHAGIYVALAKGYYAAAGLDVKVQVPAGAADAVRLVAHGTGDVAISYEPTVLLSRQEGIPVVAIGAVVQKPLNAVLALKSTGITRPRQLEGHTVGMAGEPSDYTNLQALMQDDGGSYDKVHPVNVGYNLLPALLSHRVDAVIGAYWTWEALQAQAAGKPVNVLRLERFGVPTYDELVFITGQSRLSGEPTVLHAFLKATFEGYAYAAAHTSETTRILLKVPGVLSTSRSLIRQSLTLLSPLFKDGKGRYGTMDEHAWQSYANWMTANKLMPAHLDVAQAMTATLLP